MAPERAKEITLNGDGNYFEFEMAALSYRRPEENQYQYMLEGVDKEWYNAGNKRSGRYSGLSHGTYTLRVRGSNNDGVWSDPGGHAHHHHHNRPGGPRFGSGARL